MKKLISDPSICTGCLACVVACSGKHYEKYSPELSRIKIIKFEEKGVDIPIVCKQCINAPCIKACPVNALSKNDLTGATIVNQEKCIGCGLCVEACPFVAINMDYNNQAMLCDLCNGIPECVSVCPVNAIKYEDINTFLGKKRVDLAQKEVNKVLKKWGIK